MKVRALGKVFCAVCILTVTWMSNADAQGTPQHCSPGKVWVAGHPVFKPISFDDPSPPMVWINGACAPIPPPPFQDVSFTLIPTYLLITIMYAPPGNQSEVKYGSGSSIGSKFETKQSFKKGLVGNVFEDFPLSGVGTDSAIGNELVAERR
jgi:hypothetical protein